MGRDLNDALAKLVGEKPTSVVFVMDYMQLVFHKAQLTAYKMPTITESNGSTFRNGDVGYEHALRGLIQSALESSQVIDKKEFSLRFGNGSSLSISLIADDYSGPEAFMFTLEDGSCWVC